jgi:hypothetical protein
MIILAFSIITPESPDRVPQKLHFHILAEFLVHRDHFHGRFGAQEVYLAGTREIIDIQNEVTSSTF